MIPSVQSRNRLADDVAIQHVRVERDVTTPRDSMRHRVDGRPAECLLIAERAVDLRGDKVSQVNMAFQTVVEAQPERVIAFGA